MKKGGLATDGIICRFFTANKEVARIKTCRIFRQYTSERPVLVILEEAKLPIESLSKRKLTFSDKRENTMFYIYILTNKTHSVLYTGVTNNIKRRVFTLL